MPRGNFLRRLFCTKGAAEPSDSSQSTATTLAASNAGNSEGAPGESAPQRETRSRGLESFRRARVAEGPGGRKLVKKASRIGKEEDKSAAGEGDAGVGKDQEAGREAGGENGGEAAAEGSGEGQGSANEDDAAENERWMAVVRQAAARDREDWDRARGGGRVGTGKTKGTRSGYNQQDLGFEPGTL